MHPKIIALAALLVTPGPAFIEHPAPRHDWPVSRFNHASCHSAPLTATLVFGGRAAAGGVSTGDGALWAWSGASWMRLTAEGPMARSSPVMVCDPARARVMLYGGYGLDTHTDTWEWDGRTWSQKDAGGLSARAHAAAAFDPVRGTIILFGGFGDGPPLGETWEWDGTRWTQLVVSGPPARYAHSMVSDSANRRILLYGGISGFGAGNNAPMGDLWEWNGTAWRQLASDGPRISSPEAIIAREAGAPPLLVGHTPSMRNLRAWELNGSTWRPIEGEGPAARGSHSTAYDQTRRTTVVFGGRVDTTATAELWELTDSRWTKRGPPVDEHADHASASSDTIPLLRTSGSFVGLSVADLEASTKWYTEKLGLKVTMQLAWTAENKSAMKLLQGGGLTVELVKRDEAVPRAEILAGGRGALFIHGIFKVGVVIADFDATVAALRGRGVDIAFGPFPARNGQPANIMIRDNAGNYIQLFGN